MQSCLAHPRSVLVVLTVLALAPFLWKPFNMDDPLFLWMARQIRSHPANPYGFLVNWYGTAMPMSDVMKNPPFTGYYLAGAAAVIGGSEAALHLAMFLPAVAAVLGTWRLGKQLCAHPVFAAAMTLFTPAMLVSSTTVMCDSTLLAFWTWAVALWMEGIEGNHHGRLAAAGLLTALAVLTKYFGACLLPLLVAYGLIRAKRLGPWVLWMIVPLAAIGLYQVATSAAYDRGLFSDAGSYATTVRDAAGLTWLNNGWTGLAFTGACLVATVYLPCIWRSKFVLAPAALALLGGVVMFANGSLLKDYRDLSRESEWSVALQVVFWAIGGAAILSLAVSEVVQRRSPTSWLLFLWIAGTFVFAAFFNWTLNARSILPMAPAAGILILRRIERGSAVPNALPGRYHVALAIAAVISLTVAWADCSVAQAVRRTADETVSIPRPMEGRLLFQGHWGFQYYLERRGAKALDQNVGAGPGDLIALPLDNSNFIAMDTNSVALLGTVAAAGPRGVTTMSSSAGAGFYTSLFGPLPFAFGPVPPETVALFAVTKPFPKP